ncbi:MAG TPA: SET domain-containing protein-lysine N-methyltransferase [Parachlamydiales bacterium]|nr:SET domain-containing protein-lysine N-methyltransferase [Parachlamydiales bacterium]HCJ83676.1 SET domain-containing protein-lysine N-methyltransferase [Parachlamydiales bacterium]
MVKEEVEIMIKNETLKGFFQELNVVYLPALCYVNESVRQAVERKCARAERRKKIERERKWLGGFYAKEMENELFPLFEIRWIDATIGYGVFAQEEIQPGRFVGEYTGFVRKKRLFFYKSSNYCFGLETHMGFWGFVIDAEKGGNLTRFINHSDQPNLEPIGVFWKGSLHIILRSLKKIQKGEQLTYDYGADYWSRRKDKISTLLMNRLSRL